METDIKNQVGDMQLVNALRRDVKVDWAWRMELSQRLVAEMSPEYVNGRIKWKTMENILRLVGDLISKGLFISDSVNLYLSTRGLEKRLSPAIRRQRAFQQIVPKDLFSKGVKKRNEKVGRLQGYRSQPSNAAGNFRKCT